MWEVTNRVLGSRSGLFLGPARKRTIALNGKTKAIKTRTAAQTKTSSKTAQSMAVVLMLLLLLLLLLLALTEGNLGECRQTDRPGMLCTRSSPRI